MADNQLAEAMTFCDQIVGAHNALLSRPLLDGDFRVELDRATGGR